MLIYDIIVILITFVMLLIVLPKMSRNLKSVKQLGSCCICNCNILDTYKPLNISNKKEYVEAVGRGNCDSCQIQLEREEQIQEVFSSNIKSRVKRKLIPFVQKIQSKRHIASILFFLSAIFGLIPVFGAKLVFFKVLQVISLLLGWTVLIIGMKKK